MLIICWKKFSSQIPYILQKSPPNPLPSSRSLVPIFPHGWQGVDPLLLLSDCSKIGSGSRFSLFHLFIIVTHRRRFPVNFQLFD